MALKPPASSSNPREWQGSLPLGGAGVGSSITMKKNTWTEIIRFVVTVLTALLGTAGMQSCGMI